MISYLHSISQKSVTLYNTLRFSRIKSGHRLCCVRVRGVVATLRPSRVTVSLVGAKKAVGHPPEWAQLTEYFRAVSAWTMSFAGAEWTIALGINIDDYSTLYDILHPLSPWSRSSDLCYKESSCWFIHHFRIVMKLGQRECDVVFLCCPSDTSGQLLAISRTRKFLHKSV